MTFCEGEGGEGGVIFISYVCQNSQTVLFLGKVIFCCRSILAFKQSQMALLGMHCICICTVFVWRPSRSVFQKGMFPYIRLSEAGIGNYLRRHWLQHRKWQQWEYFWQQFWQWQFQWQSWHITECNNGVSLSIPAIAMAMAIGSSKSFKTAWVSPAKIAMATIGRLARLETIPTLGTIASYLPGPNNVWDIAILPSACSKSSELTIASPKGGHVKVYLITYDQSFWEEKVK